MTPLDVWYAHVGDQALLALMRNQMRESSREPCRERRSRPPTSPRFEKLTRIVDGERRISDVPPLIEDRARLDAAGPDGGRATLPRRSGSATITFVSYAT
jgi:hypothetical protein